MLRTVQVKAVPAGNEIFQAHQNKFHEELSAKIPQELRLPAQLLDNPPLNVQVVPKDCGLLTNKELAITENYDLVALAECIAARELSSVEVVTAFARRAAIAHQVTACLTDWFLDEALVRARELDEHIARTGKTVGPLHGVPISVKEMVPIAGRIYSVGMVVTRQMAEHDCNFTATLRSLGAVFYVKTHEPTAVMSPEATSFMGRTLNPYSINLSSGGSSGGEAALIAMRGSIFGLGTDIAGSIRLPAAWCNTYGFKPSTGFISAARMLNMPFASNLNCDGILGSLATSLRDLDYIFRTASATRPFLQDPDVLPISYTGLQSSFGRPLKIGIITTDHDVHPMPPVTRALHWAHARLRAADFAVTPFEIFPHKETSDLVASFMFVDAGNGTHGALAAGHEPYYPLLEKGFIDWSNTATGGKIMSGDDVAERRYARDLARLKFAAHWQAQGDPDIVIGPAHMSPAVHHDSPNFFNYVLQWNLADCPTMVVPTPITTQEDEEFVSEHRQPISEADGQAKTMWRQGGFIGAPVGLLLAAKRHDHNTLIAAAGMIQKALLLP